MKAIVTELGKLGAQVCWVGGGGRGARTERKLTTNPLQVHRLAPLCNEEINTNMVTGGVLH
jgi:hypothetical protein